MKGKLKEKQQPDLGPSPPSGSVTVIRGRRGARAGPHYHVGPAQSHPLPALSGERCGCSGARVGSVASGSLYSGNRGRTGVGAASSLYLRKHLFFICERECACW